MSVESSSQASKEYTVQCLSELTAGATLLKAGRAVSSSYLSLLYLTPAPASY